MKTLPLYVETSAIIDEIEPAEHDPQCSRCSLGEQSPAVCMRPAGKAGGILCVGQSPVKKCADVGRPWVTPSEKTIASLVQRFAGIDTPVAFDYAVRCCGGHSEKLVEACRVFTRASLDLTNPTRVFAFGTAAAKSLVGSAAPHNVRRAWQRLEDGTVVFFFPEPFRTQSNRVLATWLREDLQWAVEVDLDTLPEADLFDFEVVDSAERAEEIVEELVGQPTAIDVETYGILGEADFKIVALSLTAIDEPEASYVWPEEALREGDPRRAPVVRLLREGHLIAHNAKYESRSCAAFFGEDLRHTLKGDSMIWAKQIRADGAGGLDPLAWQVGMGGHKREAKLHLDNAITILRTLRRAADKAVAVKVETQERTNPTTGKKQRRKVVVEDRPPTVAERRAQVVEAWSKHRTSKGLKTNLAARVLTPGTVPREVKKRGKDPETIEAYPAPVDDYPIPADWIHAALVEGPERSYVYGLIDRPVCYRYNARDTASTSLLAARQERVIEATEPFARVWHSHLGRAPWAVGRVESWGMVIDRQKLADAERFFSDRADELLAEIHAIAPGVNPASSDQLAELLFQTLKMKPTKVSEKTGKPSTDKHVLKALQDEHPIVKSVLEWKSLDKLNGTYARGLAPFIRHDGRIRASLNITGTETGRMSCSNPNMQTIPTRSEYAKRVKGVFVAPPGYKLVQIDYKALEVRIAAMLSGDPVLLEVFDRGGDPHRETAEALSASLWGDDFATCGGLTGEALAEAQGGRRSICKGIVFGTIYGQGPGALAAMTGLSEAEAERAQHLVMGRYRVLKRWIEDTANRASRTGETWTWWQGGKARRRPVPDIGDQDNGTAGHGRRQSYNTPVQGTGSEFCLASLVGLVEWICDTGIDARLVMTVHDSLIFEVVEAEVDRLVENAVRIMVGWPSGDVTVEVDVEIGDSWGDLEEYKPTTEAARSA